MKKLLVLLGCMILSVSFMGCSQQSNPTAPLNDNSETTLSSQVFKPAGIAYEGIFTGTVGVKPHYWFDADDNSSFNVEIRTSTALKTATLTRVNGGTWGKVHTFPISCSNDYNKIRLFTTSKSANSSWKMVIQEEGGAWRNWVLQASTSQTGYFEYDFSTILSAINSGSATFTINIIVEGSVGEYIEVGELYVFDETVTPTPEILWEEDFTIAPTVATQPGGWYDETNLPGLNGTVISDTDDLGKITLPNDPTILYGKIQSPTIKGNLADHLYLRFYMTMINNDDNVRMCRHKFAIQEVGGQERTIMLHDTWFYSPLTIWQWTAVDVRRARDLLGPDAEFRIEIWMEKQPEAQSYNHPIGTQIRKIGLYKTRQSYDFLINPLHFGY